MDDIVRIKNLVPGTLIYKGQARTTFKLNIYLYDSQTVEVKNFSKVSQLIGWLTSEAIDIKNKVLWVDVIGINHTEEIELIGHHFNLDNLLLEQVIGITKYSSFEHNEHYIFADLQMITKSEKAINNDNISIYVRDNLVLSFSENPSIVFKPISERVVDNIGSVRQRSSYYLFYALLDGLVDNYLDVMAFVKHDILILEEKIVNEEQLDIRNIHANRKRLLHFKLAFSAFHQLVDLMRDDVRFQFTEKRVAHVSNLQNHLNELSNELLLQQETINVLYENHMLNNSNDMNSIMTTLTLFSAIFIPLSFLTGIFGMNFAQIPGMNEPNAFFFFLIGCGVMAISMLTFFKVKKWF